MSDKHTEVKRWPFVETPGEFTDRLAAAMREYPTLLAAVRFVLIEQPPTLALEAAQRLAAQPGEPVAWQFRKFYNDDDPGWGTWHTCDAAWAERLRGRPNIEVRALYASPPPQQGEKEASGVALTALSNQESVADAAIKAAFVKAFGPDAGWLGEPGSWFIEGYKAGKAAAGVEGKKNG